MSFEEIISYKTRVKILKYLIHVKEINITELVRKLELNHSVALSHLEYLKKVGLIEEKRFGRIRIIRINEDDPRIELLKKLFKAFEEYNKTTGNTTSSNVVNEEVSSYSK